MRAEPSERGAASVEHVALATLLALLVAAAVAAIAGAPPLGPGASWEPRSAARSPARRAFPTPAIANPLAVAYGFPLGKLVRHLAPEAVAAVGPRRRAAGPGGLQVLPAGELRGAQRYAPGRADRIASPHHGLHPGGGPPPSRRHDQGHLLALPPQPGLGAGVPHRHRGRRRRRRLAAAVGHRSPRARPPGDAGRAKPLRLPRLRAPALALARWGARRRRARRRPSASRRRPRPGGSARASRLS